MYVHEEKDSIILEYIKRSWDRKHAPIEWQRKVICTKQNKADAITNCKMPSPHRSFATSPVAHLGAGPFPPPLAMRRWWNHNLTLKKLRPPRTGIFAPIVSSLLGIQLEPDDKVTEEIFNMMRDSEGALTETALKYRHPANFL